MSEIQPQVALIVDTADDLIWAELKPDLPQSARSEFLRFRDQHTREQLDLRKAVRRACWVPAAVQKGYAAPAETSKLDEDIREIRLLLEKVEASRRRLEPFLVVISSGLPQEQRDWIEREIAVLEQLAGAAPVAASAVTVFKLRPLRLQPPDFGTASEETLQRHVNILTRKLQGLFMRIAVHASEPDREDRSREFTQLLYEETLLRREIELVDQRLDQASITTSPLRERQIVLDVLVANGVVLSTGSDSASAGDSWASVSPLTRAWIVNNLVLDTLGVNSERVRDLKRRDIPGAIEGDGAAWGRLCHHSQPGRLESLHCAEEPGLTSPRDYPDVPEQALQLAASTSRTAANTIRLRRMLFVANSELRKDPLYADAITVTRSQLASAVGWHPNYLSTRAKALDVDLEPYVMLKGPLPPEEKS